VLHASFLLWPGIPARRAHEIGFVAAVAVSDTIEPLLPMGRRVALKWPNDVLIGGAKLGGILAEWLMDDAVVLGIGLNVRHSPGGLAYPTTCLAAEGCELDAPAVLLRLVDVVAAGMDALCAGGFAPVRAAWMALGPALGMAGGCIASDVSAKRVRSSRHPSISPTIPSGPERAGRAGRPVVVDTLLVRAADDPVGHRDRQRTLGLDERQHLGRNLEVTQDVRTVRQPALHIGGFRSLGRHDADRDLGGGDVIGAIQGHGRHRITPEAPLGLFG